jgi:hypothetical protein
VRLKTLFQTVLFHAGTLLSARGEVFSDAFQNPPDSTRPGVYWYWLRDNISKEGITQDLEAMRRVGIGRAYIGNVDATPVGRGSVKMFTDEWWEATAHAIREAGRLGIDIGVFNCPGWSQSGGPWVRPEQSMRYLAVSETKAGGPGTFSGILPAPAKPFTDVAVLAVPGEPPEPEPTCRTPANGAVLLDGNPATVCAFPDGAGTKRPFFVEIKYPEEVTVRSVTVVPGKAQLKVECELQYKDPAGRYQSVKKFTIERLSKLQVGPLLFGPVVEVYPAVKAGEFRMIFTRLVQGGKADKPQTAGIAEISLSGSPKLERYVEKQLGQAFPTPHTRWDAYLWKPQADAYDGLSAAPSSKIQNISSYMDSGGKLTWDVPKGNWTILRVGMTPTGVQNNSSPMEGRGMETDKMNAAHVQAHFDAYLAKLADRLSPEERRAWKYVVMDSYEVGPQNWTDGLDQIFRDRYGYDPLPWLPVLTGRVVDSPDKSDRFLWDLRRLVADKVASDYAGALRVAANARGLKLWMENYGHFGFPGESLQYGGQADEVAGEFWGEGELGFFEVRTAASSAHIYGKPLVAAEAFTFGGAPWSRSPWSLKSRGDWAMAEGVNQFILHLFIHQPGERPPGINAWFGTEFNRHNTWFGEMGAWIASFRRAHAVLQQGLPVADVAYFTGEDAPKETGVRVPEIPPGYNYDYLNGEVLLRDLRVRDGRFILPGGVSYRLLVLPPLDTMRPELLEKIAVLVKEGGAVLGDPPSRSPSLKDYPAGDERVRKLAGELWKDIDGRTATSGRYGKGFVFRGTDLAAALKTLGVPPDVDGAGERPGLGKPGMAWIHRCAEDADVYFVANLDDEEKNLPLTFRAETGAPECWDPVTGGMRPLPQFTRADGRATLPLRFLPRQSYFVAFRKQGTPPAPAGGSNFPSFASVLELPPSWEVEFDPLRRGPGRVRFDALIDWTRHADTHIKYYSGTAVYRSSFSFQPGAGRRYYVNLGGFESVARVKLNGTDLGTVWFHPGRIEATAVLKAGTNELEIAVTNTWNNRLLGDSKLPPAQRPTWTSVDPGIKPQTSLLPSGLTGPVVLEQLQP